MNNILSEIKSGLISLFIIVAAIVISIVALVVAVDVHCSNDSYYWMPFYPNAQLVETQESAYFRVRGMGTTQQVYFTQDAALDVNRWYRDYRRQITEGLYNTGNPDGAITGFGNNRFTVRPADDGNGSLITYFTTCAE